MIDKDKCFAALERIRPNLSKDEYTEFKKLCSQGISISQLFLEEIPTNGVCTHTDAVEYIKEETNQMQRIYGVYNMNDISIPEHVMYEDKEESYHHGLPKGYTGVTGAVKFFVEWLEGHHPSLGCMYGAPNTVPSIELYKSIAEGAIEA